MQRESVGAIINFRYNAHMIKTMAPLLWRYEEDVIPEKKLSRVALQDEVTFVGIVYKSILLDSTSENRNRLTKYTKVRDETTDDE
jgi:hypothetical protein